MIVHGKGHCPLAQAGLMRTINDLHVDLIPEKQKQKKPEMEGEMSPHKSNPVTAVAPLCKREAETIQRSFVLSTASGFQIPVIDSSSEVTFHSFMYYHSYF